VCSELKWAFTFTLCLLQSNSRNLHLAYRPISLLTVPGVFSTKYLIILVARLILFIYTVTNSRVLKNAVCAIHVYKMIHVLQNNFMRLFPSYY